jgi:hypothetical protein
MNEIPIGRLLRSSIQGCVVGCKLNQQSAPQFGQMVLIPLEANSRVFGLVYDIHIDDDGLVRQLVTANGISEEVIEDNRQNRNVPLEISVIFVGYEKEEQIFHLLPARPPLTLDNIYPCSAEDLARFTPTGKTGYLRHLLRAQDLPLAELLAVHLHTAIAAHQAEGAEWATATIASLVAMLKDDYPQLMDVLSAVSEVF